MIRHLKRDVLPQLPERVLVELEARLTNEDDYREAEADCIAWLREHHGELRASAAARAEALVRLGLLRQLAGAGKIDAAAAWIEEFLEESDRKLVVFCWHREVVRALAGRVPGRAGIVIGGEAARNREAVREFQSSKGLRVLVCSLAACREAIDLTCASDCLLVELPWRPADIQQAEARMYGRVNDLHGLNSTVLLAEGTIDSTLWAVLKRKQEVFDRTLGDEPDVDTLSDVVTGILSRQGGGY
jgi:SWI/SNF-related matrix-associated actin-dependent regulator 1 of chromatin subfamily A